MAEFSRIITTDEAIARDAAGSDRVRKFVADSTFHVRTDDGGAGAEDWPDSAWDADYDKADALRRGGV